MKHDLNIEPFPINIEWLSSIGFESINDHNVHFKSKEFEDLTISKRGSEYLVNNKILNTRTKTQAQLMQAIYQAGIRHGKNDLRKQLKQLLDIEDENLHRF
jgi:hypothetical protein